MFAIFKSWADHRGDRCKVAGCRRPAHIGELEVDYGGNEPIRIQARVGNTKCLEHSRQWVLSKCTYCDACEQPIIPGTPVGQSGSYTHHPYVHYTADCSLVGSYVGVWNGETVVPPAS